MSFLSPVFLIAIAAVGLPLIIHLLNIRRPQKVPFSTLAFFRELQKTTIKRIQIKKYLLLILRLLAIACLAVVLARPFLPPGSGSGANSQVPALNAILIDNSISMSRIGEEGPLIEQAKKIVRSIEASSKDSDRFILQTTNGEAMYSTIIGHNQLLDRLEAMEVAPRGNYTAERITGLAEVLKDSPYQSKRLFLITDGQQSQLNEVPETLEEMEDANLTLISLGQVEVQNTIIAGIETSTNMIGNGLPVQLTVDVKNVSDIPVANQFVSLMYEDELVGQYSVSLAANASASYDFEVIPSSTGTSRGKVTIEGDEFTADNDYFFVIEVPETRKIAWVREGEENIDFSSYTGLVLEAVTANDAKLNFARFNAEDLGSSTLNEYDAVILDGLENIPEFAFNQLQQLVQEGKGLVFFPAENGDIRNYNNFLSQFNQGSFEGMNGTYASFESIARGNRLQEDHPVYAGLFDHKDGDELRVSVPDVYYYLKFKPSPSPGGFSLIRMNTGDPLVREKRFGNGKLIVSTIGNDPGWSDFTIKPLYAPFYYRMLLYAASSDDGGFNEHLLGNDFEETVTMDLASIKIETKEAEVIPETESVPAGVLVKYSGREWSPGWITIKDEEHTKEIALNLERDESYFVRMNEDDVLARNQSYVDATRLNSETLTNEIQASGFGREIWSWFMIAGIVFLVLESLTSIFFKAETIS
ncbi:MAG TPA: hypothetical protein DEQ34_02425 [Balneolaceae bacterium]|nr:hypothetical protein [Balneolaceae bacterium]|tara:strand:+ start:18876 stop:20972 length:2097 start_codon:yes stop_codon:yes gene_type:complete